MSFITTNAILKALVLGITRLLLYQGGEGGVLSCASFALCASKIGFKFDIRAEIYNRAYYVLNILSENSFKQF